MIQPESEGLRTKGANGVNSSLKAEDEVSRPSSIGRQKKRAGIPPSSTSGSVQALGGLHEAHPRWGGRANRFTKSTRANAHLTWKHPVGTARSSV